MRTTGLTSVAVVSSVRAEVHEPRAGGPVCGSGRSVGGLAMPEYQPRQTTERTSGHEQYRADLVGGRG